MVLRTLFQFYILPSAKSSVVALSLTSLPISDSYAGDERYALNITSNRALVGELLECGIISKGVNPEAAVRSTVPSPPAGFPHPADGVTTPSPI